MSSGLRTVVFDDADASRVKYTGAWKARSNAREFGGTAHGTSGSPGDSVTIQFTGSSIQVIGTIPEEGEEDSSVSSVRLNFRLDSTDLPSYTHTLPEEHDLFTQTVLKYDVPEGDHTLTITPDVTPRQDTPIFYLDYILVTTNTAPKDNDLVFVDDTDPTLLYQGAWTTSTSVHTTRDTSAKVLFNFNGTYVKMVGSAARSGTSATVDGETSNFTPSSTEPQTIFERDRLSNKEHHIVLSPAANEQFSLDYILYRPSAGSPGNNPDLPGQGGGGGGSVSGDRHAGLSGGAIAGIVVGVILSVLLAALGLFWFFRRSRRPRPSSRPIDEAKHATYSDGDISEAQRPFLATSPTSSDLPFSPSIGASTSSPPMTEVASGSQTGYSISEVGISSISAVPDKAGSADTGSQPLVLSWTPPEALPPIVHEDSGVRLDNDGLGQRDELPPAYRPYYPSHSGHENS